jgi:hypothetical protein
VVAGLGGGVGRRAYVVGADLAAHDVVHNDHLDGERIDGFGR